MFDLISVMTGGANGTESISVYAYNNLMKFLDFGYGSSLAVLIFIVVFIISLIYMKPVSYTHLCFIHRAFGHFFILFFRHILLDIRGWM